MSASHAWQVPAHTVLELLPRKHGTALVIPVINEGDRIQRQLEAISTLDLSVDVIVADGGSTDGSLEEAFLRRTKVTTCLTKTGEGRLSAQLRMGYAWALEQGYENVITMDGNGKDDVSDIARMLEKLTSGYDYVQGSRYAKGGKAINTPLFRWFAGRFIHAPLISLASWHWFTDTTNGFRAYSARYLHDPRVKPFRDVFMNYNLLFYLSVRASQLGFSVTELGVTRGYPDNGKVPTKIAGWSGKVSLLKELFAAALGRYHP